MFQFRLDKVLHEVQVDYMNSFTYLAHLITNERCDNADSSKQRRKWNAVENQFIRRFNICTTDVEVLFFRYYCYLICCNSLWCKLISHYQWTENIIQLMFSGGWLVSLEERMISFEFAEHDVYCHKVQAKRNDVSLHERIINPNIPFLKAVRNRDGSGFSN